MVSGFNDMPRILAMDLHDSLIDEELNGRPINRISGNLANSFGIMQLSADKWALKQVSTQAPYAQRVMVDVSKKRIKMAALTHLRKRRYPVYGKAIDAEFKRMVSDANTGRLYVWNKKRFALSLHQ